MAVQIRSNASRRSTAANLKRRIIGLPCMQVPESWWWVVATLNGNCVIFCAAQKRIVKSCNQTRACRVQQHDRAAPFCKCIVARRRSLSSLSVQGCDDERHCQYATDDGDPMGIT
ncbi:hypothetical protein JQ633_00230 [Bradyrhizobium tropiciagri]|uniref:hypothetical protein n=1 Tax=Bradyrhizobium tropiciagri TaxID=312253 RepID=UPI001BA50A4B|nr:hypothetical protein [Bradyrhizobium tropiciagri]MBR0868765.1 hypothetical protein [Bradyrhizobium tropiciagri]